MKEANPREADYFRLRAEWLRFKNHVFDSNTELPTLAAVMDDVRRLMEERGSLGVVYLDLAAEPGSEAARDGRLARGSLPNRPPDLVVVHAGATLAGLEVLAELNRDDASRAPVLLLGGHEGAHGPTRRGGRRPGRILDPRPLLAEVRRHVSRESAEVHRASL